jgi:type II secretory pathway pseudopilin PulG
MFPLPSERGRGLWETLILAAVIGCICYAIIFSVRQLSNQAKVKVLEADMRNMRLGLDLYLYQKGKYPEDIRVLERDKFIEYTAAGKIIKKSYVELITKDEEGYPIDPFGNRYHYDAKTGIVHPTSPGYKDW